MNRGCLAERFSLTDEDRAIFLPSHRGRIFESRIGWANTYLKKAALLEAPQRGFVKITKRGQEILGQDPSISA